MTRQEGWFMRMLRRPTILVLALLIGVLLLPLTAQAWDRGQVETFAKLPAGTANPEGITVGPDGNVYVADFEYLGAPPGHVVVFGPDGNVLRLLSVDGSSNFLLGLDFHPKTGALLVIDFG